MQKPNIFKKIDKAYTKVVKVIIGDLPLEELKPKTDDPQIKGKLNKAKHLYGTLKNKFLNLGAPENEKELLYEEVIKKERQKTNIKTDSTITKSKPTNKSESTKNRADTGTKTKETTTKTTTKSKNSKKTITAKNKEKKATATATAKTISKTSKKTVSDKKKEAIEKADTKIKNTSSKKTTSKPKTTTKQIKSKNTKNTAKGSKRDEKIALYIKDIKKHYGEVDEDFVTVIVKNLGPSIYKKDAETVACSDPKELDTVRKNFLIKKLGIDASKGVLDAAIHDVCEELKGVRTKYRATFYYALAKKFKKESALS